MPVKMSYLGVLLGCTLTLTQCAVAQSYRLHYQVQLVPERDLAQVRIELAPARRVKQIDFNLAHSACSGFTSDDPLQRQGQRLVWQPSGKRATLEYECPVTHRRPSSNGKPSYDALMTADWALLRGDDLVPPAKVLANKGAQSRATIDFQLPAHWSSVNTEWPYDSSADTSSAKAKPTRFKVDNPARRFDRPTGWIIAGKLGTRRAEIGSDGDRLQVAVSAPRGSGLRRMDILSFVHFVWPEFQQAFQPGPQQLLIVGGDDPLWRGGLSARNSFFLHATRPIVSENGTSTLIHEIFHTVTGIRGKKNNDWIAEGLAEYYSVLLPYRAGGMEEARFNRVFEWLARWSAKVDNLQRKNSNGKVTAAAALLFKQLDREIGELTRGRENLDALVRLLMGRGRIDHNDLAEAFEQITGQRSQTLQSPLLSGGNS